MRYSTLAAGIATFIVASAAIALAPQSQVQLKLKPVADKPYFVTSKTTTTTDLSGMVTQTIKADSVVTQKVVFGAVTDGWSKVTTENTEASFKADQEIPGMDVNEIADALKGLIHEMEVNEKGEVRNYKMVKGSKDDVAMAQMMNQSQELLAQAGINGISFPEGEVTVGKKWDKTIDITKILNDSSMGMMTAKDAKMPMAFEVMAIKEEGGKTLVDIKMIIDTTFPIELAIPGAEGPGKVKMVIDSLFTIDAATGMLVKSTTKADTNSDLGVIGVVSKTVTETTVKS